MKDSLFWGLGTCFFHRDDYAINLLSRCFWFHLSFVSYKLQRPPIVALPQENESKPKHMCGFVWFTWRAKRFLIADLNWFDDSLYDSFLICFDPFATSNFLLRQTSKVGIVAWLGNVAVSMTVMGGVSWCSIKGSVFRMADVRVGFFWHMLWISIFFLLEKNGEITFNGSQNLHFNWIGRLFVMPKLIVGKTALRKAALTILKVEKTAW